MSWISNFLTNTDGFVPRWVCGEWGWWLGWTHIVSHLLISATYAALPVILIWRLWRVARSFPAIPNYPIIIFALFIVFCGCTHALDAVMFYWPNYRLLGLMLVLTGIVSFSAVLTTAYWLPQFVLQQSEVRLQKEEITNTLEKKTKALEESNLELERFAYIAAHDLQDPLRTMSAFLGLLVNKFPQPEAEPYIKIIIDSNKKMKDMTGSLLTYAKLQDVELKVEIIKIDTILKDVCQGLLVLIEESGAEIKYENLPTVGGDKIQLTRLFQNLIQNAIKYRDESRKLIVLIDGWQSGDFFYFRVMDNGLGFDVNQKEVFNVFRKVRHNDKGVGFGLAICKRIVERHGGIIKVDSVVGNGSTFKFTLPVIPIVGDARRPVNYTQI